METLLFYDTPNTEPHLIRLLNTNTNPLYSENSK